MGNMRLLPQSNPRAYGTARLAVEKTDHPRYSSLVSIDYWEALNDVSQELEKTGDYYDTGPLPYAAKLLAKVYWLNEIVVRRDLIRLRKAQVL